MIEETIAKEESIAKKTETQYFCVIRFRDSISFGWRVDEKGEQVETRGIVIEHRVDQESILDWLDDKVTTKENGTMLFVREIDGNEYAYPINDNFLRWGIEQREVEIKGNDGV